MLMPLSLFTVLQLFCFSVSNKNEAGKVSLRVSRVSTYIYVNIKLASPEVYELAYLYEEVLKNAPCI